MTLARAIPAEQCVSILNPFIEAHEFPFNLAAIKMQLKVIEAAEDKDIVRSLLPTLIPRLLKVSWTFTILRFLISGFAQFVRTLESPVI